MVQVSIKVWFDQWLRVYVNVACRASTSGPSMTVMLTHTPMLAAAQQIFVYTGLLCRHTHSGLKCIGSEQQMLSGLQHQSDYEPG